MANFCARAATSSTCARSSLFQGREPHGRPVSRYGQLVVLRPTSSRLLHPAMVPPRTPSARRPAVDYQHTSPSHQPVSLFVSVCNNRLKRHTDKLSFPVWVLAGLGWARPGRKQHATLCRQDPDFDGLGARSMTMTAPERRDHASRVGVWSRFVTCLVLHDAWNFLELEAMLKSRKRNTLGINKSANYI